MSIIVTGRKMNVTDALREYAEEKIGNSMKVMDIDPLDAEVVLSVKKNPSIANACKCEVTIRTKGHVVHVEESETDMYAAIDVAAAKVLRQLRKFKTRVIDKRIQLSVDAADMRRITEEIPLDLDKLMDEVADDNIVREKDLELEPLTTDEALLQMDLLGHDFFVYLDRDSSNVHVLYRRKDGGYGLLRTRA